MHFSVSPMEKTGAQIQFLSCGYVPIRDAEVARKSEQSYIADN
jgi:hypothetical protein